MDIFISHSSKDSELAKLLIDLLKTSLNISSKQIRCTSVNGYRLPAGASTDARLREEVHDSKVLIGLISPNSVSSAYVLFELGARWGASLPLIPLVTSKTGNELLQGPLSGINALNCCEPAQLHQLVSDLKEHLNVDRESPEVYQEKIDSIVTHSLEELLPKADTGQKNADQGKRSMSTHSQNIDAESNIKAYCEEQYPHDYSMRVYCIREQKDAFKSMSNPRPSDIPEKVYSSIVEKAVREYPIDYTMQVYSVKEQVEAYRELERM